MAVNNRFTICWDCKNARANLCPRFQTAKRPLDIWEEYAEGEMTLERKRIKIYMIKKCKLFERDDYTRKSTPY